MGFQPDAITGKGTGGQLARRVGWQQDEARGVKKRMSAKEMAVGVGGGFGRDRCRARAAVGSS